MHSAQQPPGRQPRKRQARLRAAMAQRFAAIVGYDCRRALQPSSTTRTAAPSTGGSTVNGLCTYFGVRTRCSTEISIK